jgi:hypothetical protein
MQLTPDFERLRNHVSRYADKTGQHPITAAAQVLEATIGRYSHPKDAIEYANRWLTRHGLELVDHRALKATPPTEAYIPTPAPASLGG